MGDLILKIFNMSFNAGIMVLAVLVIRIFTKKAPKIINVLLWLAVALRLCLPFSLESALSLLPSKEVIISESSVSQTVTQNAPTVDIGVPAINDTVNEYIGESVVAAPNAEKGVVDVMLILGIVWAIGFSAMLIYACVSYIKLRKTVQISLCKEKNIYYCDNISSPFVTGIIKPKIYLPSDMAKEDEQYVLMHEIAHIKRKDYLWKPLGFLLLSVHWFNPLIWVGYAMLCRDIELACDEKAIKNMSKTEKINYSNALLNCSIPQNLITVNPLTFGGISVKKRIKNVLNYKKPAMWITVIAIILSCALMAGFLTDPVDKKKADKKPTNVDTVTSQTEDTTNTSSEPTESIVSTPTESTPTESKPIESNPKDTSSENDNLKDKNEIQNEIKNLYLTRMNDNEVKLDDIRLDEYKTYSDGSVGVEITCIKHPKFGDEFDTVVAGHNYKYTIGYYEYNIYKNGKLYLFDDAYKKGVISKKIVDEFFERKQKLNDSVQLNGLPKADAIKIINDYINGNEQDFCEVILKYKLTLSDSSKVIWIGKAGTNYAAEWVEDFIAEQYLYEYSSGYGLIIYKNGNFRSIKNAYDTGLISKAVLDELFKKMPSLNKTNNYISEDDNLGDLSIKPILQAKKAYLHELYRCGKVYANNKNYKDIIITNCGKLSDGTVLIKFNLKNPPQNPVVMKEEIAGHIYEYELGNDVRIIVEDKYYSTVKLAYEKGKFSKEIVDEFFAKLPELK